MMAMEPDVERAVEASGMCRHIYCRDNIDPLAVKRQVTMCGLQPDYN